MAQISDTELKNAVKSGKLSNVYYLYGKDVSAVENAVKMIRKAVLKKEDEAYNLHSFSGKNLSTGELENACEALPVFASYVCCTVNDLNSEALSADSLKDIISIVSGLPDTTILIFYNTSVDVTDGKKYPTAKNKKLIDSAAKNGTVCNFEFKTPRELSAYIITKVSKNGGVISKQTAEYLAGLCGFSTMLIENETDKLIAYSAGNEITVNTVNELCSKQLDSTSFDLARAIVRHDKKTALRLLDELMLQRIEVISVLYAVTASMTDLYRAKSALDCGKTPQDVIADFSYAKNVAFRVENAFKNVKSLSSVHLRECMKILTQADIDIKSLKTDKQIILEEAVIKMLSHSTN